MTDNRGPAKRYVCTVSSPSYPRKEYRFKTRAEMYTEAVTIAKQIEKEYGDKAVEFSFTFREE